MTTELTILTYAIILGIAQLLIAAQAATSQRGMKWNLSPRDEKMPELTGVGGRLDRAFKNFMQSFPFFLGAIALVHFANRLSPLSTLGAEIYLAARIIYVPLYAAGIPGIRSLVWLTSMVGIGMILWSLLL